MNNITLTIKLTVAFLTIALLPIALITHYSTNNARNAVIEQSIANLFEINQSKASNINHTFRLRQEQAKEIAGTILPRQLASDAVNSPELVRNIQTHIDSILEEMQLKPHSGYLDIDKVTAIQSIGVFDVNGLAVASSDLLTAGTHLEKHILDQVRSRGSYFGGFKFVAQTQDSYIETYEQIRNWKTTEFSGVIRMRFHGNILNEITALSPTLGRSGQSFIVDKNYRVLTHSNENPNSVLNTKIISEVIKSAFDGKNFIGRYKNYRDTWVVGATRLLVDQEWVLVVEIDEADALSNSITTRNDILKIATIFLSFVVMFAILFARSISIPILNLRQMAIDIGEGNLLARAEVSKEGELGELSMAFNQMAENIMTYREDKVKKNKILADSTKEIKLRNEQLLKAKHEMQLVMDALKEEHTQLEKANLELDSFVYTASHDLRAPLRAISSFTSFLEEDYATKLDAEGKNHLEEIRNGADRMGDLIEDLLTLSKVSRIQSPYESVDMNSLLNSVIERIKFDIKDFGVKVDIQKSLPSIVCDKIKMGVVMVNLISNSIKFSSKIKARSPHVELKYVDRGENHEFRIIDNGIGIDKQYHKEVFGIFKRLHTDKEYRGSGAGLSIVKRIINDHQGDIWIESELGQGAAFCFKLPKNLANASSLNIVDSGTKRS
ncbi:MAG: signal transduction histidine kinase [Candidatus Omnitrophota bacterium]|jgi:signal transduction histidine kinase